MIEVDYWDLFVEDLIKEDGGWMVWLIVWYGYDMINRNMLMLVLFFLMLENWLGIDD